METPHYTPPGGPPQVERPNPAIYEAMGQDNIFRLCEDFYAELEHSDIRPMFPEDMVEASQKQAKYFVFLLGGPPLFQNEYGHPRLRGRHMPFPIDEKARQTWLDCFTKTLGKGERYDFPEEYLPELLLFLDEFSKWMVNKK